MRMSNTLAALALAAGVALGAAPSQAAPLTVGAGWTFDEISGANVPSNNSPWTFTLTGAGFFRLTDAFNVGDIYQVFDGVTLLGTSAFNGPQASILPIGLGLGAGNADGAWTSGSFSTLTLALAAGSYSLTIQGDAAGGAPAGFFVRADIAAVPAPAALGLLLLGLAGLAATRRRA